jgi:hypothetical protein
MKIRIDLPMQTCIVCEPHHHPRSSDLLGVKRGLEAEFAPRPDQLNPITLPHSPVYHRRVVCSWLKVDDLSDDLRFLAEALSWMRLNAANHVADRPP